MSSSSTLTGSCVLGQPESTRQPADVRVDRQTREVEGDAAHDVGRLAPDTGQRHEVFQSRRHLTAEALFDSGCHPQQTPRLVLVEAGRADDVGDLPRVGGGEVGGRRLAAEQSGVTMLTRTSVVWADRIVATSNSHGLRWSSSQTASGYSIGQASGDFAGPTLRSSRLGHPVTRSFATVALMGSEPAGGPPATIRRLDAASGLNVQRLLDDAARADGFVGLSDQLAADLDDLIRGVEAPSVAVQLDDPVERARRHRHRVTARRRLDDAGRHRSAPPRPDDVATGWSRHCSPPSPARAAAGWTGGCTRRDLSTMPSPPTSASVSIASCCRCAEHCRPSAVRR